ncbi:MAG: metal ABC transporter permease [Deltaproteobacteria bacterium]|nr:metal ABC transporter permease [Deltaproteobacteria bacterium]
MELSDFLSYGFIQRALISGSFIALLCSTLGVFLVLKRLSLIGDGLAHVTFGSVALGLLLKVYPIYVSIPVVMASSLGIMRITERARIHGDVAIGIVSSIGIAAGVLLASIGGGFNIDLFSYLFGNILAISKAEMFISMILSLVVIFVIGLFYNEILSSVFDEESAKATGIKVKKINTILMLLTAVTVVLAMKMVGIMLVTSFLILPAVTAFQVARSFRSVMIAASSVAVLSVVIGILLSAGANLPSGAVIILTNFAFLILAFLLKKIRHGS